MEPDMTGLQKRAWRSEARRTARKRRRRMVSAYHEGREAYRDSGDEAEMHRAGLRWARWAAEHFDEARRSGR